MKKMISMLAAVCFIGAFFASIAFAVDAPKTVTFKGGKKGAVAFDHKKHSDAKITCVTCHHTKKDKEDAKKCGSCHKAKKEGKTIALKKAFHKQCKDCHKKMKKGPTKCKGCHVKKK